MKRTAVLFFISHLLIPAIGLAQEKVTKDVDLYQLSFRDRDFAVVCDFSSTSIGAPSGLGSTLNNKIGVLRESLSEYEGISLSQPAVGQSSSGIYGVCVSATKLEARLWSDRETPKQQLLVCSSHDSDSKGLIAGDLEDSINKKLMGMGTLYELSAPSLSVQPEKGSMICVTATRGF